MKQEPAISRRLGGFELFSLSDGVFRLDGGAMFGIVPRVLWEKQAPPDGLNRILMAARCLLVRTPSANVLVDTGIGNEFDDRRREQLALAHPPDLASSLAIVGLSASDIDVVANTHLHFDHAGGNTVLSGRGERIPAFPRARYLVSAEELACAREPGERSRGSYREMDWLPLLESGVLETFEGETELAPGVRMIPTPGHTRGHCSALVESGGEAAIYFGDLVPTSAHLGLTWVMGYDLEPQRTVDTKKEWAGRCADNGWLAVLEHDPSTPFCRVGRTPRGFESRPA